MGWTLVVGPSPSPETGVKIRRPRDGCGDILVSGESGLRLLGGVSRGWSWGTDPVWVRDVGVPPKVYVKDLP